MKRNDLFRMISMVLALFMLAGLVSCANGNGNQSDTSAVSSAEATTVAPGTDADTSPEDTTPTFREANYNNEDFNLLARSTTEATYNTMYMMSDGINGDYMNDAVYKRNVDVETKYNIKLKMIERSHPYQDLPKMADSGDKIDLMYDQRRNLGSVITQGYLLDMLKYDYIMNFESSYWDANAYEEYRVANRLYMMPNDVSTQNLAGVRFLYFNKNLITNFKLTSPYTYIENNEWTLEKFIEITSACVNDENGDGKYDKEDVVGLVYDNTLIKNLISGCGVKFTETQKDGTIVAAFNSSRTESVISTLRTGLQGQNYAITYDNYTHGADMSGFATKYTYTASLFAQDKFMFIYWGLNCTELLSEMEGYGVAPNPMFDKDQGRYYHRADGYVSIFSMPTIVTDPERTATILEYWAYKSSQTVMPSYYDVTIKARRVADPKASNVLDIVKGSIRYEISSECQSFGIDDILNQAYESGNFSSLLKGNERVINSKIKTFYDAVVKLDK